MMLDIETPGKNFNRSSDLFYFSKLPLAITGAKVMPKTPLRDGLLTLLNIIL